MPLIYTGGSVVADTTPTLSGIAAVNAQSVTVTDTTVIASGYSRGLYINYTSTGIKTGSAESNPLAVDMNIAANHTHAFATSIYTAIIGTPTIGDMAAYYCYCDNLGATAGNVNEYDCLSLNIDSANPASGSVAGNSFIRMYAHGGATTQALYFPSSQGITNLITFLQDVAPLGANTVGGGTLNFTNWKPIAIKIGTTTHYLVCAQTIA